MIADIDGVKENASYEHDKVRCLQQSIMTSLDVKQNQIVKVHDHHRRLPATHLLRRELHGDA
ncbi:hypothetical protein [Sinosporangium siamense]|uniref:hypothetical protein n=1 Tax=Sinosporangium siamense TaxID=1367973 RepID=UPI00194E450C|nr:hypothetical protein [Sinosporangium siamense]